MIFWIVAVVLLVVVAVGVVWPLVRGRSDARDEADFDIEVFRDQLTELDREHREGRLQYAEAEAAKKELHRKTTESVRGGEKAKAAGAIEEGGSDSGPQIGMSLDY